MNDAVDNIYDNLLDTLRTEFVDEAEDNLNSIDELLEKVRADKDSDRAEAIVKVKRVAHSLKGSSGVADFPLVTIVMHRLEDYLESVEELKDEYIDDIQTFIDKAREYSSIAVDQRSVDSSELSRTLPEKIIEGVEQSSSTAEGANANTDIIETLMVIKEKTAGLLFERELRAAGMRVTTVRSSFAAIEMAVRTKPDLIIISGVLDELTGVDVAAALKSMPKTKDIAVALLTSFGRDHHELEGLPKTTALIQKNHLKDDLLKLLGELELI